MLAFVFASFIAIVPLITAAVAIMSTLLVVRGLAALSTVSMIVQFLIALIGLGVAIDYSLLIIVRWREERANGANREEAVVRAMATAGRAVTFSGLTVAVGLLALVVLPGVVHALGRRRGHADPADLGRGRADAFAGDPRNDRPPA